MGIRNGEGNVVIDFVQARISAGRRNASIGTAPPEMSLRRLARLRDASFLPAKMLRRCHSEHSAPSARACTDIPAAKAQASSGCGARSDMDATISTRNEKSQAEIFLGEIASREPVLLPCGMGKSVKTETPKMYLADWLDFFELGPTEAAAIAGVGQSYISNIMANRKPNVNVLILLRLSEHLGVTVNDFYRPLPSRAQLHALQDLSPKARGAILERERKKA